jgi:hypothetical protein
MNHNHHSETIYIKCSNNLRLVLYMIWLLSFSSIRHSKEAAYLVLNLAKNLQALLYVYRNEPSIP